MYKLLKPTHIGINYMVERLQDNISSIGHESIQSLKGENVCQKNKERLSKSNEFDLVTNIICGNIIGFTYEIY
jgi:hypothetical protein